jgi:mono/diheme cytochrome c family protein
MKNRESTSHGRGRAGMLGLAAVAMLAISTPTPAQDAAQLEAGKTVWVNTCAGCHGVSGQGGAGGDLPAGPSLRTTELDRDGLLEVISCGRPGTQMPAWLGGAYTVSPCYGLDPGPAPAGTVVVGALSAEEIETLVDYILTEFVQKPELVQK